MYNKWVKICWNKESILHTVICIYVLYEFCIKMLYIMFMMHAFCRSELCMQNVYKMYPTFRQNFVYKMYIIKCVYAKCILHFDKLLHKFCIQDWAGIVLLILYTKCIATKVYQNVVYILHTFSVNQLYTSCTIFVYKMYTQVPCWRLGVW